MNKVIISGNVVRSPENSKTNSGISVSKFTLAVQRKFKNESGEYEADFINIVAWRQVSELVEKYINKGDKIAVVGSLQIRTFEANDGSRKTVAEVIAEEVEFLNVKENKSKEEETKQEEIDFDDLPF